ncbi:Rieske (2Fe-2S) protein [Urbifossiella limnaea]|uniref:Naphthalene 1,2-dioxygenase/salicylate 5-hydroxylase system, ferredoxin component n=1 Tax=Urbifossiella limnaea TaxID=2528023 RepID=A0A517XTE3_9BACT|nr:Rieske 2Fe-2S domain-containing protein [Urbifossiella limnaea]QDU20799.1 Naphthalene 1,2-dioxygenase/salicylate 5-hydroxylase system, ferredoxin component [Urbifossiella limnaea]
MGQRIPLGKTTDLPAGATTVVEVNGKDVAVFHHEGRFFAVDDLCPHMGASLSGGFVEGGVVTCPWHYWRFRLDDGSWADNPKVRIGCYPVHVEGDDVVLEVPEQA